MEENKKIYSVLELNTFIKRLINSEYLLSNIYINGEASNVKYHNATGHIYFTIKSKGDSGENYAVSAVMFRSNASNLTFRLEEGMGIIVNGRVDVYERDGRYQIYVNSITKEGVGDLYQKLQELMERYRKSGVFNDEHKKPIPKFATRIGVCTAPDGAAFRDIEKIIKRRNPYAQIVLYPALVQGVNAKLSIARGIETLDKLGLDVIIVGRGGGSIEDLWAFNEPEVAKAIFYAETPIISAVGHQIDYTISDYIADKRAATPSEAAEIAAFDINEIILSLDTYKDTLLSAARRIINEHKNRLKSANDMLTALSPAKKLVQNKEKLSSFKERIGLLLSNVLEERKGANNLLADKLKYTLSGMTVQYKSRLPFIRNSLLTSIHKSIDVNKNKLKLIYNNLDAFSPVKRISSGYGYLESGQRRIVSVRDINVGDNVSIYLKDGKINTTVNNIDNVNILDT
ncbi:MAG: exodeoxyribonuclease VII large subunit [Lachnospiraceae bacterium]|nr:exodeoxyribonuclease VII large subunit [Lachnospiraceae bacterium]